MSLPTMLARRGRGAQSPGLPLKLVVLALLGLLIAAPLGKILFDTLQPDTIVAWRDVLVGRLSRNLFWLPLWNTLILGFGVATICVLGCAGLLYIGVQPPNDKALWITLGAVALTAIVWFAHERKAFAGPPSGVLSQERMAAIEKTEKVVGQTD